MLAILLSLGFWQLSRLAWKTALLADIAAAASQPPVSLTADPPSFRRVVATGRFLPGTGRFGVDVRSGASGPTLGSYVMAVLDTPELGAVVVDRGWAPDTEAAAPPGGVVTLEGYVRPAGRGSWFTPRNDMAAHRFFTLDPAAIGQALGAPEAAPFVLVAMGQPTAGLQPAQSLPQPSNDHLSYAMTWFALAAGLVVIFGLYVSKTLREGRAG